MTISLLRRWLFIFVVFHWLSLIWIGSEQIRIFVLICGFLATTALVVVMRLETYMIRLALIKSLEESLKMGLAALTFRQTFMILSARGKMVRKHRYGRAIFFTSLITLMFAAFFTVLDLKTRVLKTGVEHMPFERKVHAALFFLYLFLVSILFLLSVFQFSSDERRLAALTEKKEVPIPQRWKRGVRNPSIFYEFLKMFLGR